MIIATWNVNSVLARLPLVLQWLGRARPDVLCLQETKCADERFPAREFAELGYSPRARPADVQRVAILARAADGVQRGFPGEEEGAHARLLAATVGGVRVVNVYVPNGQSVGSEKFDFKLKWVRRLREFFDEECWPDDDVLLCGDFNVAPEDRDVHDPELWRGKILCSRPEREALGVVKEWGFADAFRLHNEGEGHYSWLVLTRRLLPPQHGPAHRPRLALRAAGRALQAGVDRQGAARLGAALRPHARAGRGRLKLSVKGEGNEEGKS